MNDVSKGEGRTVLFVSHNMPSIQTLCSRGIFMQFGKVQFTGLVNEAISEYFASNLSFVNSGKITQGIEFKHPHFEIDKITVNGQENGNIILERGVNKLKFVIEGEIHHEHRIAFGLELYDHTHSVKLGICSPGHITGVVEKYQKGKFKFEQEVLLPSNITKGTFKLDISLHEPNVEIFLIVRNSISVETESVISATGLEFEYANNGLLIL